MNKRWLSHLSAGTLDDSINASGTPQDQFVNPNTPEPANFIGSIN